MTILQSNHRPAAPACRVYVDFDGTIAPDDPTDALFAAFADPSWLDLEAEFQEGRMTSIECMARQVGLLRMTPAQLGEFIAARRIDQDFRQFVAICRASGMHVTAVSDGLDLLVGRVLGNAGLDLPFVANALVWRGGDRWALEFPHRMAGCSVGMGNCKCSHASFGAPIINVMVGDGRSDFCIAERSDLVLAKGKLADHCRREGLPHVAIRNFADANLALLCWLALGEADGQPLKLAAA